MAPSLSPLTALKHSGHGQCGHNSPPAINNSFFCGAMTHLHCCSDIHGRWTATFQATPCQCSSPDALDSLDVFSLSRGLFLIAALDNPDLFMRCSFDTLMQTYLCALTVSQATILSPDRIFHLHKGLALLSHMLTSLTLHRAKAEPLQNVPPRENFLMALQ